MTDIVERLRKWSGEDVPGLLLAAADEIERLREERDNRTEAARHICEHRRAEPKDPLPSWIRVWPWLEEEAG